MKPIEEYTRTEFIQENFGKRCPSDLGINEGDIPEFAEEICKKCWELATEDVEFKKEEIDLDIAIRMAGTELRKGQVVRHFKGKDYEFMGLVTHSETKEVLVLYKDLSLYGREDLYVRPVEMFFSRVDKEKYPDAKQEWRFEFMDELKKEGCE